MRKVHEIKRVLVPVSFDQPSEALVCYAGFFAQLTGAQLVLLHCTGQPEVTYTQKSRLIQSLRAFGQRIFSRSHPVGSSFVRFECVVRPRTLQAALKTIQEDLQLDLLLAHNTVPATEHAYSSHPVSLSGHVNLPVILVPPQAYRPSINRLVFATDFTDRDPVTIQRITHFAYQLNAQLTLVHMYTPAQKWQRSNLRQAMLRMKGLLADKNVKLVLLEEEDLVEGISEFVEQQAADMLILATQDDFLIKQLLSKAYTKTMAYHTQIPIVTFRQEKQKPCSGSCANCAHKKAEAQSTQHLVALPVHVN